MVWSDGIDDYLGVVIHRIFKITFKNYKKIITHIDSETDHSDRNEWFFYAAFSKAIKFINFPFLLKIGNPLI